MALYKLSAFTTTPEGGNPAGVWIGRELPEPAEMQRIAAEVGFSETAFVAPETGSARTVRYYSPAMEVPFCGHATIAAGVLLGELEGDGSYRLSTRAGEVPVSVRLREGFREASLTSVAPEHGPVAQETLAAVLELLGWSERDLDRSIPPARAFAGAWHLVLAAARLERLEQLNYEFEAMRRLMLAEEFLTLQLVHRERADLFHARDPFPVGGVVEDPATGAAAAALGGYLRDGGFVKVPAVITILQGVAMGRPSRLKVEIPESGGIVVSGTAVHL